MSEMTEILSVAELNRRARGLLEHGLGLVSVEGEISNMARPASGHLYFTLKDAFAQVRCALFRGRGRTLNFRPENGMQVLATARVSLYEARGDYQLLVETLEEAGDGALLHAFEALKQRLASEGLFAEERKRPLPTLPGRIGVITSPSGAAIRDILHVLERRFPAIEVVIYPVPVQGEGAAQKIAGALTLASDRKECDVLLLARGGGSLEDLWAFNEEVVARAIIASQLPVVSGIGHEIDFTIADFAADRRAPTPSAAAELLSPDRTDWLARLRRLEDRLSHGIGIRLQREHKKLAGLERRLHIQHPGRQLQERAQRCDELQMRLERATRNLLEIRRARLAALRFRLERAGPNRQIERLGNRHRGLLSRLRQAVETRLLRTSGRLQTLGRALDAVSPLATLERGYAIVRRENGEVVREAKSLKVGDRLQTRLAKGEVRCAVEAVSPPPRRRKTRTTT